MMASLVSTRPNLAELAGEDQEQRITHRETHSGVRMSDETHDNANTGDLFIVYETLALQMFNDCKNVQFIRVQSPRFTHMLRCSVHSRETTRIHFFPILSY